MNQDFKWASMAIQEITCQAIKSIEALYSGSSGNPEYSGYPRIQDPPNFGNPNNLNNLQREDSISEDPRFQTFDDSIAQPAFEAPVVVKKDRPPKIDESLENMLL